MRARANRKLEALAEAIASGNGYFDPDSPLYSARNPGGLRPVSLAHERDEFGNRVFASLLDGWQALLYDLDVKLSGKSPRVMPTDPLFALALAYDRHRKVAGNWVKFLRRALNDHTLTVDTALKFFKE